MTLENDPAAGIPSIDTLEAFRVPDSRFAKAYVRTGDRGRALIKTAIARLYAARAPRSALHARETLELSGGPRTATRRPRPWCALALDPEVLSPLQLVAAIVPAVAHRASLVLALRPRGRGGWPDHQLAALELCGVEHAFSPPFAAACRALAELRRAGPGLLLCLGSRAFRDRLTRGLDALPAFHWLEAPRAAALHEGASAPWNREVLDFAHKGLALVPYEDPADAAVRELQAAFAPGALAPPAAGLVLEPGCEGLWDWPELPDALFFAGTLVYG